MSYEKCLAIATKAHEGQFRKDGKTEYITHPIAVANCFSDDLRRSAAVLHDVIEDTSIGAKELLGFGVDSRVVELVKILSRRKEESYNKYISRVLLDPNACSIKIADIKHNLLTTTEEWKRRKYMITIKKLKERVGKG